MNVTEPKATAAPPGDPVGELPVSDPPAANRWPRALVRVSVTLTGAIAGVLVFGFVLFATTVMRGSLPYEGKAEGIIVLTGGDLRIQEGGRLLREGRATRLLISGVNDKTSRDDLIRLSGLDGSTFVCCVDLGYAAQDTIGNAEEAKTWVAGHKVGRVFVVTSSYHMPRSLAELALALPGVELIPHPVVPRKFRNRAWWLQPVAARLLLSEYVKFLPVAARLATMRYLRPWVAADVAADTWLKPAQG